MKATVPCTRQEGARKKGITYDCKAVAWEQSCA